MSGLFGDDTLTLYLKLKEAMKQYVRDAFGGSLNAEVPNYPQMVADQAQAQQNTLRDAWGDPNKMADATLGMMNGAMGSFLPFGITAWHGSPHKFPPVRELLMPDGTKLIQDLTQSTHLPEGAKVIAEHPFGKFDLSKIGSGEGAQAYGHGLYLAESKNVADSYSSIGKVLHNIGEASFDGVPASRLPWLKDNTPEELALRVIGTEKSVDKGLRVLERLAKSDKDYAAAKQFFDANKSRIDWQSARPEMENATPNLYKTDIPDEAVARFLDWDKPLSQQTQSVRQAITKLARGNEEVMVALQNGGMGDMKGNLLYSNLQDIFTRNAKRNAVIGGDDAAKWTHDDITRMATGNDAFATQQLQQHGILGIRYLDGGSRGAGTGTSNFVVFDPEMIRILERNGVATGAKPWQPGEWQGLLSGSK